ncbi:Flp pilus assembly protein CpaB [Noviherbaspirillum pedocola]|uniref:Flp pilus assembly protein CpaB n=1 Tax=Noviherbaspirillum pedocola TaxID=2801341 RepID=A0A934W5C6_9BURK|nr:Flp pilus assembly protein CpaB [Noviherbaspirillum pedocola]MBK4733735.1 Flp pilus assembly protein CpaB [Noviherbaspirillum pedocola]
MKLRLPSFPRVRKAWLLPAAALGIGLFATVAANRFLSGRLADIEAKARRATVDVVVARRDIGRGEALKADSLALRAVPKDYAPSGAVRPEDYRQLEGRVLQVDVKDGEMILWGLLQSQRPPSFSARVAAGRRAMTLSVDEINSISGMLEPGDSIDMLASIERKGKRLALPLVQDVRVMATGQRAAEDPATGERRQFSTVTVDVTPQQAASLILARETGRITALLRNPADRDHARGAAFDLAALLGGARDVDEVPVLYGGTPLKLPPEALQLRGASGAASNAAAAYIANPPSIAQPELSAHSARASAETMTAVPVLSSQRADGVRR